MISLCLAVGLGLLIMYLFLYRRTIKEKLKNKDKKTKKKEERKAARKAARKGGSKVNDLSGNMLDPSKNSPSGQIIFEGTDVIVMRGNKCCDDDPATLERQEYYTDYEKSYSNTTTPYPEETIRFDLLTPIPYSDAFAAPMGPRPTQKDIAVPYLSQISYTPTFKT